MLWQVSSNSRQDKFGFYTVGAFKTYSKLEALELADKTNSVPTWHFNTAVFDRVEWTKEPAESISELYRRRAQQIRDTYDYVVLWYSGGADSHNILHSFIENDIKLDECVSLIDYQGTKNKTSHFSGEIFYTAIPSVAQAKLKQTDLKHRIVDMTEYMIQHFYEIDLDWIYGHNGLYTPWYQTKATLKYKIKDWQDLFSQGKKVGFVSGVEKPLVLIYPDGRYYFSFNDFMIDNSVTPKMQMTNEPWDFNELFYWSPDCPELLVKQHHIIKNFLKTYQPSISDIITTDYNNPALKSIMSSRPDGSMAVLVRPQCKNFYLNTQGITSSIYPNWRSMPYQNKANSTIIFDKDLWFIKQTHEQAAKNWLQGMLKVLSHTKRHSRTHRDATATIQSKLYQLGI